MDRPSATEMDRGCASEMDGRKSAKKNGNATEIDQMFLSHIPPENMDCFNVLELGLEIILKKRIHDIR